MNQTVKNIACAIALFGSGVLVTSQVLSQDKKQPGHTDEAAMQEMMAKLATPGTEHAKLQQWVGNWDLKTRYRMDPTSDQWEESTATSSVEGILGGRYIIETVKGSFDMGDGNQMPFEGRALMGFSNGTQKYFSHWVDNMNTGSHSEYGTADATGKTLTFTGENFCCQTFQMVPTKSIVTVIDNNTRKMEMWGPGPDGKTVKHMEITYVRRR